MVVSLRILGSPADVDSDPGRLSGEEAACFAWCAAGIYPWSGVGALMASLSLEHFYPHSHVPWGKEQGCWAQAGHGGSACCSGWVPIILIVTGQVSFLLFVTSDSEFVRTPPILPTS